MAVSERRGCVLLPFCPFSFLTLQLFLPEEVGTTNIVPKRLKDMALSPGVVFTMGHMYTHLLVVQTSSSTAC